MFKTHLKVLMTKIIGIRMKNYKKLMFRGLDINLTSNISISVISLFRSPTFTVKNMTSSMIT